MPRKPRIELSEALYHVISRGNNRYKIFGSHADYLKFIDILQAQKLKLPFYRYAYCLMSNHVHLLIEMDKNPISHIMQRALGSEEFLEEMKHRVGERRPGRKATRPIDMEELLRAAEIVSGESREEFCSNSKKRKTGAMKEAVIVMGRRYGIRNKETAALFL